jgi:hypothetical protein
VIYVDTASKPNIYFVVAGEELKLLQTNRNSQASIFNSIDADQASLKAQEDLWAQDIEKSKTEGVEHVDESNKFGFLGFLESLTTFICGIGLIFIVGSLVSTKFGASVGFYDHTDAYDKTNPEHDALLQKIAQDQTSAQEITGNMNNKIQIQFNTTQQTNTSEQDMYNSFLSAFNQTFKMQQRA